MRNHGKVVQDDGTDALETPALRVSAAYVENVDEGRYIPSELAKESEGDLGTCTDANAPPHTSTRSLIMIYQMIVK